MEFPGGRRCCSPAHSTGRPAVPGTWVSRRGSPRSRPPGHGPPAGEPPRQAPTRGGTMATQWQPIKLFLNNAGCVRSSGRSQNYVHLTKQDYENSFLTGELFWSFFFSRRAGFLLAGKLLKQATQTDCHSLRHGNQFSY